VGYVKQSINQEEKMMKLNILNLKITGANRRFVLDQLQKYADRFADRKFSSVELTPVYGDGTCAIHAYDVEGRAAQTKVFDSKDMLIGYILGANAHMGTHQIIKELH